jgi:uncharacterized protein
MVPSRQFPDAGRDSLQSEGIGSVEAGEMNRKGDNPAMSEKFRRFAPAPPPNLERLKTTLEAEPTVLFALVFGSFARGEARPDSDLDVAVLFSSPPEGLDVLDWLNRLSDAAEREVDLVVLNRASPLLRHQVMMHRIRLMVRDEEAYIRFRERTMRDYDEYLYVSGMGKFQ